MKSLLVKTVKVMPVMLMRLKSPLVVLLEKMVVKPKLVMKKVKVKKMVMMTLMMILVMPVVLMRMMPKPIVVKVK